MNTYNSLSISLVRFPNQAVIWRGGGGGISKRPGTFVSENLEMNDEAYLSINKITEFFAVE